MRVRQQQQILLSVSIVFGKVTSTETWKAIIFPVLLIKHQNKRMMNTNLIHIMTRIHTFDYSFSLNFLAKVHGSGSIWICILFHDFDWKFLRFWFKMHFNYMMLEEFYMHLWGSIVVHLWRWVHNVEERIISRGFYLVWGSCREP